MISNKPSELVKSSKIPLNKEHCHLLMAPQMCLESNNLQIIAERMITLYDWVVKKGYRMSYIGPNATNQNFKDMTKVLGILEKQRRKAVIRLTIKNEEEYYFLQWPKDGIQIFKSFTAITNSNLMKELSEKIESKNVTISDLCEGGLMVRFRSIILLSSAGSELRELEFIREHYNTFILPEPISKNEYQNRDQRTHIDLDCALVIGSKNKLIFLVSEFYYKKFNNEVEQVCKSINSSLFVVPQREAENRLLNLISFPFGGVIIPSDCPISKDFLLKHLEPNNVYEAKIDEFFNYNLGNGGLGCMSNIILMK